jgi:hypothetical protein
LRTSAAATAKMERSRAGFGTVSFVFIYVAFFVFLRGPAIVFAESPNKLAPLQELKVYVIHKMR